MRGRVATLAAVSALALAFSASPALAGSPMFHVSVPATDTELFGSVVCGNHVYTFTSGDFSFVSRDFSISATVTATNVWATDGASSVYRVVGAEHYGPTLLASKLMCVSQGGGIADSINIAGHASPNGVSHEFDFGTCNEPG